MGCPPFPSEMVTVLRDLASHGCFWRGSVQIFCIQEGEVRFKLKKKKEKALFLSAARVELGLLRGSHAASVMAAPLLPNLCAV